MNEKTMEMRIKQLEEEILYWKKAHLELQARVTYVEKFKRNGFNIH